MNTNTLADVTATNAKGKALLADWKVKLSTDFVWATRALIAIYKRQTAAEQQTKTTDEDNGVGFTGIDAHILTSFAEFFERNGYLSHKQQAFMFRKMPKYAGQLLKIAQGKA